MLSAPAPSGDIPVQCITCVPFPGQDEARHEADDRAVRAQRRQVEKPPFRLPWVLLHKTANTPRLVLVVTVCLGPPADQRRFRMKAC
eukprot:COSAG01_NODE_5658_length_4114_cov_28.594770_1_plen_87_part_00